jgi:hypothetical protein
MTERDAKVSVDWLRGLFPAMTSEQGRVLVSELQRYDADIVEAAGKRLYSSSTDGFFQPGKLKEMIASECRRRDIGRQIRSDRDQKAADRQQMIRDFLADYSDDELRLLKTEALTTLKPDLVQTYSRLNPRKHPAIQEEIYLLLSRRE